METEKELVENVENTSKVEKKTRDYKGIRPYV